MNRIIHTDHYNPTIYLSVGNAIEINTSISIDSDEDLWITDTIDRGVYRSCEAMKILSLCTDKTIKLREV